MTGASITASWRSSPSGTAAASCAIPYFMENEGIALSREKILNHVWNYDYFGDARTIDTHVKKLRAKIGEKGDYIKTIWGMGYKFEAEENGSDK